MMSSNTFPAELFVEKTCHFLDTINYHDANYNDHEDRVRNLQIVYQATAEHFAQPLQQELVRSSPLKLQAAIQTIVNLNVCTLVNATTENLIDMSIYYTYICVLDDDDSPPEEAHMATFYADLVGGKTQAHPWWRMLNAHMPQLLAHYGSFAGLNLVRATLDFFQGCTIEATSPTFNGARGATAYPLYLRRLTGLGHCMGSSISPSSVFPAIELSQNRDLANQLATAVAQMEHWAIYVNDLLSYYKEYDLSRDEIGLVNGWVACEGISKAEALERVARLCVESSEAIRDVILENPEVDERVKSVVGAFCTGYVTWHMGDKRYRLSELKELGGEKLMGYLATGSVASVDAKIWARPKLADMVACRIEAEKSEEAEEEDDRADSVLAPSPTLSSTSEWLPKGAKSQVHSTF